MNEWTQIMVASEILAHNRMLLDRPFRRDMAASFTPTVTLYDQFGRPVQVPSTAKKIGETITVPRPERDYSRAGLSCANCGEIDVLCRCTAFADPRTGRACTNSE